VGRGGCSRYREDGAQGSLRGVEVLCLGHALAGGGGRGAQAQAPAVPHEHPQQVQPLARATAAIVTTFAPAAEPQRLPRSSAARHRHIAPPTQPR